jgi:hypothetical protein
MLRSYILVGEAATATDAHNMGRCMPSAAPSSRRRQICLPGSQSYFTVDLPSRTDATRAMADQTVRGRATLDEPIKSLRRQ